MENKVRQIFQGVVVSNAMSKTVVVKVTRQVLHPKYRKRYKQSRTYKVHDEKGMYKEGDQVKFVPCRPISKDKKWRVLYAK